MNCNKCGKPAVPGEPYVNGDCILCVDRDRDRLLKVVDILTKSVEVRCNFVTPCGNCESCQRADAALADSVA